MKRSMGAWHWSLAAAAAVVAGAAWTRGALAHETDQHLLPADRPFADLGEYLGTVHCLALERVVNVLNARIDEVLARPDGPGRDAALTHLHDPELAVDLAYAQFSDPFTEVLDIEHAVRGAWADAAFPGQRTAHWSPAWTYSVTHLPLDPRRFILLFQSSTIKADGVYFGTDKLSHFHHMGHIYVESYRARRAEGQGHDEAVEGVAHGYAGGSIIAENALLGWVATGVLSNADLAANYAGFKFYRNIVEPVMAEGMTREPLIVRKGEYWRLNYHVRPESGWFNPFISDHWNEALNPPVYSDRLLRSRMRAVLRSRAEQIMHFYTTGDGRPADGAYYDDLARELSTLFGEDYGHVGPPEELLTLGNACVQALHEQSADGGATPQQREWRRSRAVVPIASAAKRRS